MGNSCLRSLLLSGFVLLATSTVRAEEEKITVIEEGRQVSIEYTLTLDDGTTADSNVGKEPLVYQQGSGQVLVALEQALVGLKVDDQKNVTLSPEEGYGPINPDAVQEVPLNVVPEAARKSGERLVAEDQGGNRRVVRVREVKDDTIVLDLNHPLAGKTLHFEVKVLAID